MIQLNSMTYKQKKVVNSPIINTPSNQLHNSISLYLTILITNKKRVHAEERVQITDFSGLLTVYNFYNNHNMRYFLSLMVVITENSESQLALGIYRQQDCITNSPRK